MTNPSHTELAAFDRAVAEELPRVSHLEYDSHEICKHFAGKLRERLSAALESPERVQGEAQYPLPDELYESKDWKAAGYAGRVEWLHAMYEAKKKELDSFLSLATPPTAPAQDAQGDGTVSIGTLKSIEQFLAKQPVSFTLLGLLQEVRCAIEGWPTPSPQASEGGAVTVDSIRAAGGIVHSDGNIFFTNIDKLRATLRASSPAEADEALMRQALEAMAMALHEMCHTVAPRFSFTAAVDGLDSAITALRKRLESSK